MRYAMVIYTGFKLKENAVKGYLVMILGVVSLEKLLELVDDWSDFAVQPI
jgi:chemotaxis protein CheC